jgi:protein-S-isoprenylcysteine O-methyltransferase Ste14
VSTGTGPETDQLSYNTDTSELALPAALVPTSYAIAVPALPGDAVAGVVHEREIRPRRRLRWWQILPIALLAALGSLMFAFPLAFGSNDSASSMIGMLGLLLTAASLGWGAMAARKAGYKWPGVPRRGSGRRASRKALALYTLAVLVAVALAVWRVVHLRG